MRDPNRINWICDTIKDIWHRVPDWRLGQLMCNAMRTYEATHNGADPFYVEDIDFMNFLNDYITHDNN